MVIITFEQFSVSFHIFFNFNKFSLFSTKSVSLGFDIIVIVVVIV